MFYFAYGSNLDWAQMKKRCPSVRFVAVARLVGYKLAFTRFSDRRLCGVADVVEAEGSVVWGVVYEIDERDFEPLDQYEGYLAGRTRNAYERVELTVLHNGQSQPAAAWIYVVCEKSDREHAPNAEYKRLMTEGARYWGLPQEYVSRLDALPVCD